jgi:hypothetical protein
VEFGGKNNAYFLGLQKKRQIKKAITKLLDDETLSASQNSLQFFKSLLILAEYFNIMSFILS